MNEKQKTQARLRKRKQRDKDSVTSDSVTGENVTLYPAILKALVAPERRVKLEKIYQSLKDHRVDSLVRYGCYGPTFDTVGELLEVTR